MSREKGNCHSNKNSSIKTSFHFDIATTYNRKLKTYCTENFSHNSEDLDFQDVANVI